MTTVVDIANRALLAAGIPKKLNSLSQDSTEAQTINSVISLLRDDLIRMAPWNCVTKFASLTYISSIPGTPENAASGPPFWTPGQPAPPYAYEYQYPADCLRARYIIPQYTAQAGGVPVYPSGTVTGANQVGWTGPALKFMVSTDLFFTVASATVANGGTGYVVGDIITLAQPSFTFPFNSAPVGQPPANSLFTMGVGAPALLQVQTAPGGVIGTVAVFNPTPEILPFGGSYFSPANPNGVAQGSTFGAGTGATFNLVFSGPSPQRVILCNQESAILCYNGKIFDPNVMDPHFQDAWINVTASRIAFTLLGDISKANSLVAQANAMIMEARKSDGNEDITVNDVTPDWLRTRGNYGGPNWEYSPNMSFDWGSFYSPY